jgi:drug/metabolite transporter (DMT)-like permease
MSLAARPADRAGLWQRLIDQPYLLLSLTSLFWAGNAVIGRYVAGQLPPATLSVLRWGGAFLVVLPFAWPHWRTDWPAIRSRIGLMLAMAVIGVSAFNTLQYTALQYTSALNVLLLQSTGPLFVALWSLLILKVRLTWVQLGGMLVSLVGVLIILMKGDLGALAEIRFNYGDLIFLFALAMFGLYPVLTLRRPPMNGMSFLAFTFGVGALLLVPLMVQELMTRPLPPVVPATVLPVIYVAVFPSFVAYLCYNRGVAKVGANRAAPFFHLIPVFGAVMAIVLLGEKLQPFHLYGFVLVLAGVVLAARKPAGR